jgi:hypothetical protein
MFAHGLSDVFNYSYCTKEYFSGPNILLVGKFLMLWYKPEGRGFDSWFSMVLGSTQPLIEMSTRRVPEGYGPPSRKADNLVSMC